MICVFDCETIPDIELIRKTFDVGGEDFEATKQALAQYESKNNTTFLPHPYHKIIAISVVFADDYGRFKKVGTFPGESEEEIVAAFLRYIDKQNPRLVSFNGRSFDMPVLLMRALKYNLSCPAYFEQDNQILNKTKWENYRSRYSEQFHLDLMDVLGNFGAVRGLKLDTLCQMIGIPGKFDVSGDQVMELFYANELQKIEEYCESDVLNTYLLFLKYEMLKGNMTKEDYFSILAGMQELLPKEKSYSDIFLQFIERECDGSYRD